jgi:L-lactate utilization protein LutB
MKAEQVRDGRIDAREATHEVHYLGPIGAMPPVFTRNGEREQTTLAQGVALGLCRATCAVPLHGRRIKARDQVIRDSFAL